MELSQEQTDSLIELLESLVAYFVAGDEQAAVLKQQEVEYSNITIRLIDTKETILGIAKEESV